MIDVKRDDMLSALTTVCQALGNVGVPILGNVLVNRTNGVLSLTATDLELAIVTSVPCAGLAASPVEFTLPAKLLLAAVKAFPKGCVVTLAENGPEVTLTGAGGGVATFPTLPASEFPSIAQGVYSNTFTIPDLSACLSQVAHAISKESTRYYLNGVYLHAHLSADGVDELRMVATDGHRLAVTCQPLPNGARGLSGVIIPRQTVASLRRLSGPSTVQVSHTRICVTAGGTMVLSKLVGGDYPDYCRVIPAPKRVNVLTVDRKALIEAVKACKSVSTDREQGVALDITAGHLALVAKTPDRLTCVNRGMPVTWSGAPFEIRFNAIYLLDTLAVCRGKTVELEFGEGHNPTRMDDGSTTHLIMPGKGLP